MVDSINNNNVNDLQSSQLSANQQIAKANLTAANGTQQQDRLGQLIDLADISDAAKARLNAEKATSQFVREINSQEEEFDTDKVALFKNMLDSGKINQYLSSISNDSLADALMNSPMAVAFQ